MKITKIGHCCLVIEVAGLRIMTDPGHFSTSQTEEKDLDFILITHEHQDHIHVESLKKVLENNPTCKIITNSSVKNLLDAENISASIFEDGEEKFYAVRGIKGINLFAKTCPHVDIYDGIIPVQNTGYMIENRLFYPGDAWLEPGRAVEILAIPTAGPWHKVREMMNYAVKVKPKVCFNVHDGFMKDSAILNFGNMLKFIFASKGLDYRHIQNGDTLEF